MDEFHNLSIIASGNNGEADSNVATFVDAAFSEPATCEGSMHAPGKVVSMRESHRSPFRGKDGHG
jgi:hypothetical protein